MKTSMILILAALFKVSVAHGGPSDEGFNRTKFLNDQLSKKRERAVETRRSQSEATFTVMLNLNTAKKENRLIQIINNIYLSNSGIEIIGLDTEEGYKVSIHGPSSLIPSISAFFIRSLSAYGILNKEETIHQLHQMQCIQAVKEI